VKIFADSSGREWQLSLTLGSAREIRDRLSIDILQPESGDPPLIQRLCTDELLLGETILVLLAKQIEGRGLTDDDVRASFDGATLGRAVDAFYAELVDFFRSRGRTDRARAVETSARLVAAGVRLAEARMAEIDTDRIVAAAETARPSDPIHGETSGSSPGG